LKLIYYEACLSAADAIARERYLKSGMGKRYLKNRLKDYLAGPAPLEARRLLTGEAETECGGAIFCPLGNRGVAAAR